MPASDAQSIALGKLLLIQHALEVLPNETSIASFLYRSLSTIPGVKDVHVCIRDVVTPDDAMYRELCRAVGDTGAAPTSPPRTQYFPLRTPHRVYGALFLSIDNEDQFAFCQPYLANTANIVATLIESRDHLHQLNAANELIQRGRDDLEVRVTQRTADLLRTNEELQREMSERKVVEEKNQRLTQLYAALSHCNQAIVRCTREEELFPQICRSAVQLGGMKMAWIGLVDETSQQVKPVASYGAGAEYLEDIQISVDANDPFGHGPTGTAVRGNQPYWCQDFQHDPATTLWRERAARFGWNAVASLPLQRNGVGIGVFALCADKVNAFDAAARNLLVEMAIDISFALDNFAREAARKQAEVALADSTYFLKTILDTVPVRIFWKDKELRYLGCNPAFSRDAGAADPADLLGKDDYQLGWKEQAELYRADDRRVMDSGIPRLSYDEPQTTPDGKSIWLRTSKVPLHDAANETIGVLGIYEDITERKQAEIALQHSEDQLNRAQAVAQVGSWYLDVATNRLKWSVEAFRIFGISQQEAVDLDTFVSTLHPDDRERVLKSWNEAIAGAPYDIEHRVVTDGETRWVRERALIERDSQDRPISGVGTVQDITERKQTEALLKAQQTQLKLAAQVFTQSREGITISDARGNLVMVNKAFTAISGYTEAELLGKNSRILSSGRHSPAFYRAMWDSINAQDSWAGEIWDRRKDGTEFPAWLSISTMRDEQGQITHYLGNFSDLSDAKAAETRIQWLSHFDALTGLPNRTLLKDRTAHSISVVQRASEPLTMMLVSIDHFRRITDTLGHHTGDELLMEMAKRLSDSVRAQDTVARLSGKEFVLVLPSTASDGAAHLATELLWKLAQPYQLGGHELTVTTSIGIASYPDNGSDFDSLFKAVEIAMHRAQVNGRDAFQFYSDDIYQQVRARDHMTKALLHAAALEQLQLVYQPLVDLQTGQISGLEALLRWHHPELGSVSPVQFIPLAEESGLIKDIGEWVLRRACRDIRTWLDKGIKVPHVAVNVSPLQFRDPDLIGQVKNAMSESQVDPALIYLEVTEGALMADVPCSEAILKELKGLGVKLALDDFGTGYSSLSYLKRFPFDKVKIDQSFVREVTTSQSDNVLVNVIISMAHGLGLKVIAEGVETEAQCEFMRTSGCDEIQGYFFSRPISVQAIEELFSEGRQLPPHLLRLQKPQRTLLLVDDEPNIVAALKRLFRRDGHIILTANSGLEGLDVLSKHKVDIIISDQRMPGMTGVEFLRAAKVNYPDTIRIVLSGYTELQSVTDAINEGAVYRFLTKPWEDEQLREHIQKAFEYKELLDQNQQLDMKIRTTNQELVAANRQLGDVLQQKRHQIERDETSLAIVREALQHIPLPVIGVDDEGLIAFVNAATAQLFRSAGPLLGVALANALPTIDAAIAAAAEGEPGELLIEDCSYRVTWHPMGANSRSQGRTLTLTKNGPAS